MHGLVVSLQKMRNLLAHHRAYVFNKQIYVSKPKSHLPDLKQVIKKRGVVIEIIEKYEGFYDKLHITSELIVEIFNKIDNVEAALLYYLKTYLLEHKDTIDNDKRTTIKSFDLTKGSLGKLKIIKY